MKVSTILVLNTLMVIAMIAAAIVNTPQAFAYGLALFVVYIIVGLVDFLMGDHKVPAGFLPPVFG